MARPSSSSDIATILARLSEQMEVSNAQLELLKAENNELKSRIDELSI